MTDSGIYVYPLSTIYEDRCQEIIQIFTQKYENSTTEIPTFGLPK